MKTFPRYHQVQLAYEHLKSVNPEPTIHLKVSRLIRRMEALSDKGATQLYTGGVPKKARHCRKWQAYGRRALKICKVTL